MKCIIRHVIFAALLLLPFAGVANAQHLWMDSNGDGVNTSADVLNPNGTPTTVDVWINTSHNRDGSLATCDTGDGDLATWNSYAVNLGTSTGAVTYTNFANQISTFTILCVVSPGTDFLSNTTEMTACRATGAPTANGGINIKLFTITVTGTSGTPSLHFIPFGTLAANFTSFGTACSGNDFDNTYKLGSDFQDADGIGAAVGGNLDPVIVAPTTATGAENALVSVTGSASDPDASDLVTLSQTNNAPFLAGPASAGPAANPSITLSGTPSYTQSGNYTINWSAADDNVPAGTATASTALTITNVDRPPAVTAPTTASGAEGTLITFTATASDPDAEAVLAFSGAPLPAGASFTSNAGHTSGTFSWTPSFTQSGTYNVTFTATNVLSGTASTAITVTNVDRAPAVTAPPTASGGTGTLITFTVSATDPDGDAIASLTGAPLPSGATFTSNAGHTSGSFNWTPTSAQTGTFTVTFTASNALSGNASTVITVSVGDRAPVVTAPATASGAAGELITFTVSASDPDGDPITSLSLISFPVGATFTANGSNTLGTFNWTPSAAQVGDTTATFAATNALTGLGSTLITVTSGDHAPVVIAPPTASGAEGTNINFTVSASDADADPITSLTAAPLPTGATFTAGGSNTSGTFDWTPSLTQSGSYNVTFTASNALSGSATTAITVSNVDRAPTVTAPPTASGDEMTLITFTVSAADPDGDAITSLTAAPLPTGATFTANGSNTAGTFSWTPSPVQSGVVTVTFTAANALSGSASTEITVNNVDAPPAVVAPATLSGSEGVLINFTVTASDPDGDAITSLTGGPLPTGATFTASLDNTSGTFDWTPAAGQTGVFDVTFTATNALSGSATTHITVGGVNHNPGVAAPATETTDEGVLLTFNVTATDQDGDHVTLAAVGLPIGALFTDNGDNTGTFTWTPAFTQSGTFTVTFNGSDGNGGTGSATTTITVNDVNRAPTADAGGPYTGIVNVPLLFNGSGSSDPDGDLLTYLWDFGDATSSTDTNPTHTYTTSSTFNVTLTVKDPADLSDTDGTTATIANTLPANSFTVGGNKTTSLGAGKPYTCVQVEPSDNDFAISDVDLTSIKMVSSGTGSVSSIPADASKTSVDGDKNGDGAAEITACFKKADLRLLFSGLSAGRNTVEVTIEGDLLTGGSFSAPLTMTVKSTGGALAASISPNPLNPQAKLSFATTKPGAIRVQMFDPQGRLVKTIADERSSLAGYHDFTIDGRSNTGGKLASGVYFVKVWSEFDGSEVRAVTVLK